MRKLETLTILVFLAATGLAWLCAGATLADPNIPETSRLLAQRSGGRGGLGRRGGGGAPSQGDVMGFLTGRVASVDKAAGSVTVQTKTGALTASFSDNTISTTKPGDDVLVGIALINTRTATISGPVVRVDSATGEVTVQTASGPLTVRFPSRAVQGVRQGDEVILKLDLTSVSPPLPVTPSQGPPQPKEKQ
jgi:hypothetical protein